MSQNDESSYYAARYYLYFQPLVYRVDFLALRNVHDGVVAYRFAGETRWTLMNNEWVRKDRAEWRSKRLASSDIPSIASIFFIANSTGRRDAARSAHTRAPQEQQMASPEFYPAPCGVYTHVCDARNRDKWLR